MDTQFGLEQLIGVTIIFTLAAAIAWMLRRQSAASRYLVWFLGSVAALLLPFASMLKPAGAPTVLLLSAQTAYVVDASGSVAVEPWWTSPQIWLASWSVGFVLLAARLIGGIYQASRKRSRAQPSRIRAGEGSAQVRLSDQVSVPETFGFVRPVILLPIEAANWSSERLDVVLAHELVHVERHDWLTQLIAQFSACVYWFHPLAWLALTQIRKERELACDDGVLRQGFRNSEYAKHLLDIARCVRSQPDVLTPSVPMAARSQFEGRLRAILNPHLNRGAVTTMMKLAATVSTAFAIFLFSSANGTAANPVTVSGTISDASGALVPNAFIVLRSATTANSYAATSSNSGGWELRSVAPGAYNLTVQRAGFAPHERRIEVGEFRPLQLDVQLAIGSIQETVTVQGTGRVQAPPVSGSAPTRLRIGGDVQAAKLLRRTQPVYPQPMKDAGITGIVILRAVIGTDGSMVDLNAISPEVHPELVEAAIAAVRQWQYEPTLLNGVPVEVATLIHVNFTLQP